MGRRRQGTLLPLEVRILDIARSAGSGDEPLYGFALASALSADDGKSLASHGTLYKALGRLSESGMLEAEWEDPVTAEAEHRPRRRFYRITEGGRKALAAARAQTSTTATAQSFRPVQP
jgi:PadR family transcriptional regulator PadR